MHLLTVWEGPTGKYLACGHDIWIECREVHAPWARAKDCPIDPARPTSNSVNNYFTISMLNLIGKLPKVLLNECWIVHAKWRGDICRPAWLLSVQLTPTCPAPHMSTSEYVFHRIASAEPHCSMFVVTYSDFDLIFRASFPYISLQLWHGWKASFIIPQTLLSRGTLNWGSTKLFSCEFTSELCCS